MEYLVMKDFTCNGPGMLAVKNGEVILNVERVGRTGWLAGTLRGNTGRFPDTSGVFLGISTDNLPNEKPENSITNKISALSLEDENIYEDLQCPICMEIPDDKIYQCSNGHTICQKCSLSVKVCPQCRSDLKVKGQQIRNRLAESLVSKLTVSCPFSTEGCTARSPRGQIGAHKDGCSYNPNLVQLCRYFGYKCDFWSNALSPDKTITHFKLGNHKAVFYSGNSVILQYNRLSTEANRIIMGINRRTFGLCVPVVLNPTHECPFLLISKITGTVQNQLMTLSCVQLENRDSEFEVEFCIMSPNPKVRNIKWKETPVKLSELKLESSQFGVPMTQLEKLYNDKNKSLSVLIKILGNRASQVELERIAYKTVILDGIFKL